jgi:hypothetical protein
MSTIHQAIHDFGRFIPEAKLKAALTGLNPGFHFDVGGNLEMPHPQMNKRQGVYFHGRHLCSMDRDNIPEYKVWMLEPGVEDVSWGDIDRYDDCKVTYMQILPTDAEYLDAYLAFESKRDGYHMDVNGKLFHYRACRPSMTPSYIEYVGWRHTLHRILSHNLPGVNKGTLCQALGLDVHNAHFNEKVAYTLPNT